MPVKEIPSSRKKHKQCLTLTGDVTDILRAINLNNTNKSLKSNTHKLVKTINQNDQVMTEDDLDSLFNNAAKNKNPKHQCKTNMIKSSNNKNCIKKKNNQTNKTKENLKKSNKLKTEVKIDTRWANDIVKFNDTFKSEKPITSCKYNNFANNVKFLKVDDEWDRLLTGLPIDMMTQNNQTEENVFDEKKIDSIFGTNETSSQQKVNEQKDLTQEFKRNYLVGKIVGEGAYASVRVAIHKPTNKKIAIKVYQKTKIKEPQRKKSVRREIKILQLLNHPNIVKIYDVVETNHHLNIIMEYLSGISLSSYLKSQPNYRASEKNCKQIIKPLIQALSHIHQRHIAHRDIKLENIILEDNLSPKLIDFGFSTCIEPLKKVKIFCGTPSYMAPEIVQKKQYRGQPADIWAMGVLFFVSLTGIFPFKGATDQQLYIKINNADYPRLQIPSKQTADLISKMLKINPDQRITADEILNHPWIKSSKQQIQINTSNVLNDGTLGATLTKIKLNNTNNINISKIKKEESVERKKRTTASNHKSKEQANSKSHFNKKLAQTYKQNLKYQLRLAKQSPSNRKLNASGIDIKKQEALGNSSNFYNNINPNVNIKFLKTQKLSNINSSKKDNSNGKTHAKVLDLLRMQMRKRQDEKSKGKNRRI